MATYLITGSSRGLGLSLVTRLASLPITEVGTIIATSRQDNSPRLRDLVDSSSGRVRFVPMDVTDTQSVQEAVRSVQERVQGRGVDVLVNNAGIFPGGRNLEDMHSLNDAFNINVTSVHQVTNAFLPLLRQGQKKTVANIKHQLRNSSTSLGSISLSQQSHSMPGPAYKITKAALNMLTAQYAHTYAKEGFVIFALSPGWLQTDMGGPRADLAPETSADAIIEMARNATAEQNGRFLNIRVPGWEETRGFNQYDGGVLPW